MYERTKRTKMQNLVTKMKANYIYKVTIYFAIPTFFVVFSSTEFCGITSRTSYSKCRRDLLRVVAI